MIRKKFIIISLIILTLLKCTFVNANNEGHLVFLDDNIYNIDVSKPLGLDSYFLDELLKGTSLEGYGNAFYMMEKQTGTNAVFAIAVSMLESGIESKKIDPKNNYFGLSYGGSKMRFDSIDENILAFGKLIQKPVYKNVSFETFSKIYCPPKHAFWRSVVSDKYRKLILKAKEIIPPDYRSIINAMKMESSVFC